MDKDQQRQAAEKFRSLHKVGEPLVLTNIWDAGSAKTVAEAGAPALATGSDSVAGALGYEDGEQIPFDLLIATVQLIMRVVSVPVSVDLETGFAEDHAGLADNIVTLLQTGAIGINVEDGVLETGALRHPDDFSERIRIIRAAADREGIPLFINARTDVFLREPDAARHGGLISEASARATAYAEAGADGFFVPGLQDPTGIAALARDVPLPLNVMDLTAAPKDLRAVADLGVSRLSMGPMPYRRVLAKLREEALAALKVHPSANG